MDLIVLLSVLAITHSIVLARPSDMGLKTKRSTSGKVPFSPKVIKLPTELRNGFTVTINGTIDTKDKIFEIVLPAQNKDDENHCKIQFDKENSKLEISPAAGDSTMEYLVVGWENTEDEVHAPFSIKIMATNQMFLMSLDGYGAGPSEVLKCPIDSYEDFGFIEFRQGLHNVTSLLFEF